MPRARAVFLDRDGTIIVEKEFISDPAQVQLIPGAAEGIRKLKDEGFRVVVVSNQSGIGRGMFTYADYERVQARLEAQLLDEGVVLDGVYICPHHPDFTGPCDCRKPALKLFEDAARNLDLDLAHSYYVGDRLRDIEPALRTGGQGILVLTGYGKGELDNLPSGLQNAPDLGAAAQWIVENSTQF